MKTPKEQLRARGYRKCREPFYWWSTDTAVSGKRRGLTAHYGEDGNPKMFWFVEAFVPGAESATATGPTLAIAERRAIAALKKQLLHAARQAQAHVAAFALRDWP